MRNYNKINNLVGWLAFTIAAVTYCMTIEPTASFGIARSLSPQVINWKWDTPRRTFLYADS